MSERPPAPPPQPTPVYLVPAPRRSWLNRLLTFVLVASVVLNLMLLATVGSSITESGGATEKFHSGDRLSTDKIARVVVDFTISPPFTKRILDVIDKVKKQDDVKGVVLVINSPGGLVSDSHEIYHKLRQLSEQKPMFVSMKGLAASGGYYIAMGAGPDAPLYAEPTTWTGSIGVILPRYNISELGRKIGVQPDSLATGPLKDTLNPFKEMTAEEKRVWTVILDDSFNRFLSVIDESRTKLDLAQIRELATGQVYTADQALQNGLIDHIGFEEDVLDALKTKLGLKSVRIVDFEAPKSLAEQLLGADASAVAAPRDPFNRLLEAGVPRAMYLFGWQPGLSSGTIP